MLIRTPLPVRRASLPRARMETDGARHQKAPCQYDSESSGESTFTTSAILRDRLDPCAPICDPAIRVARKPLLENLKQRSGTTADNNDAGEPW